MNMHQITMAEVMCYLLERSITNLPASALSEVFDRLIWCLDDNGDDIQAVRKQWLAGADRRKVEIALYMSEAFPFNTREELSESFENIVKAWPDLKERCQTILSEWDTQYPTEKR